MNIAHKRRTTDAHSERSTRCIGSSAIASAFRFALASFACQASVAGCVANFLSASSRFVAYGAPADRVERRDGDRSERIVEAVAAEKAYAVGREFRLPKPSAEDQRDDRVLAARRAQERGEPRMPGCDVAELARDQEAQFAAAEMLVVLARDDERIRFPDTDGRDRHERIVANEHLRRGDAEPRSQAVRQLRDLG
jgi:hypothetical protein